MRISFVYSALRVNLNAMQFLMVRASADMRPSLLDVVASF